MLGYSIAEKLTSAIPYFSFFFIIINFLISFNGAKIPLFLLYRMNLHIDTNKKRKEKIMYQLIKSTSFGGISVEESLSLSFLQEKMRKDFQVIIK